MKLHPITVERTYPVNSTEDLVLLTELLTLEEANFRNLQAARLQGNSLAFQFFVFVDAELHKKLAALEHGYNPNEMLVNPTALESQEDSECENEIEYDSESSSDYEASASVPASGEYELYESETESELDCDLHESLSASQDDNFEYDEVEESDTEKLDEVKVEAFSSDSELSAEKSPSRESSASSIGMFAARRRRLYDSPSVSNSSSSDNSRRSSLDGSEGGYSPRF